MPKGLVTLPPWITTEGLFCALGIVWFAAHAAFPALPDFMPLGIPIPGFESLTITPGLLVGLSVIPVAVKLVGSNTTPFVGARTPTEGEGK